MSVSLRNTEEMAVVVAYMEGHAAGVVDLAEIYEEWGLEKLGGNYTDSRLPQGDAFLLAAALGIAVAQAKEAGRVVDLAELGGGQGQVHLYADGHRITQIATALKYFALSPEEHRVAQEWDEDTLADLADEAEELRGRLD
ncbi:imm68 putative immunity domain-containing protein [Corynebacterium lowii]|uniref:Uncharacterized protein n=1 Tax=Corynebacterium lowii TaxID=1544413 RepID=A0A0Q0YKL1_9CORY|nr:imm68 putative immunity domain-containing protein [Corynebacterium lowii]KQB87468.1 hypothetical protein Clow_00527 [Corynebacterium lowii]MDP9851938.1 hypothetical protein [Corynebacterium lowii]